MTEHHLTLAQDTLVEGKYRIKRLLAEGGMGAVYHAVQEPLGRDVALKLLKPQDDTPDKRAQREKRFLREAAVSGKLTHPNTITIVDYGKLPDEQGFFLVMEYLEGKSLRELLIERGSLGTRVTLHIAMQIASSVADAHRHGAIHRDLKPPNVMLVPRGEDPYFVKVVDFGLVKELEPDDDEELTAENHLVGSPMYMAPERFLTADADLPVVDVYSLGIMIYEMLVGRPPFIRESDSTLQHIMMQHLQDDVPPMRELRPDLELPNGLEDLVMRALAKHPDDRIGSMDALLTLLKTAAAGAGMSVAGVVEDTGAFVPPADVSRESGPLDKIRQSGPQVSVETEQNPRQPSRMPLMVAGVVLAALIGVLAAFALWRTGEPTHLVVNSTPSGATVWLGQRSLGATPYDGPLALEEPATIRVEKDGFESFEYRVVPRPGEQVLVEAKLASAPIDAEGGEVKEPEVPVDPVVEPDARDVEPPEDGGKGREVVKKPPRKRDPDIKLNR